MAILFCTRLIFDRVTGQTFYCEQAFEVIGGKWEYGSYCSFFCATCAGGDKVLPQEAGSDTQTPDELLGTNAFRRRLPQLGADECRELQVGADD